jgi:hypothetical protein
VEMARKVIAIRWSTLDEGAQTRVASERVRVLPGAAVNRSDATRRANRDHDNAKRSGAGWVSRGDRLHGRVVERRWVVEMARKVIAIRWRRVHIAAQRAFG